MQTQPRHERGMKDEREEMGRQDRVAERWVGLPRKQKRRGMEGEEGDEKAQHKRGLGP